MATSRRFECPACGSRQAADQLFEALLQVAQHRTPICALCETSQNLHLNFEFGLNASEKDQVVLGAFLPRERETWNDGDSKVTFYPFLVVTHRIGRDRAAWLPYWHTVENGPRSKTKYGQWAPAMDMHLFVDLVDQAREAGLLGPRRG